MRRGRLLVSGKDKDMISRARGETGRDTGSQNDRRSSGFYSVAVW